MSRLLCGVFAVLTMFCLGDLALAATRTGTVKIKFETGPLDGNEYVGTFSYDDSGLGGGLELALPDQGMDPPAVDRDLKLTIDVDGFVVTETDDEDYPDAPVLGIQDGVPVSLDFFTDVADSARQLYLQADLSAKLIDTMESTGTYELTLDPLADTTPPAVACTVDKESLWPPNGKLVDVGLNLVVEDAQDADPTVQVFVFSNEAESNAAPDAVIGAEKLELRAKRNGSGKGRVYLIVVAATDEAGNTGYDCCTVTVRHNQSKMAANSVEQLAIEFESACELSESLEELFVALDALGAHQLGESP